jgi:N utilization substance protein B
VAHSFYPGDEPGLVNAVLDRLAREVRPGEVGPAKGSTKPGSSKPLPTKTAPGKA